MEKRSDRLQQILKEKELAAQQPYAYWLNGIEGVGAVTAKRLVQEFETPKAVYEAREKELRELTIPKVAENIVRAQHKEVFTPYEKMCRKGIAMIPFYHTAYPKRLLNLPDAPFGLYVKGKLPADSKMSLAIVGARNCSEYGRYVAECFAGAFAKYGVQIVSGMAKGIDGIAGEAALAAGGDTYAVLGCGVDICYPAANAVLYEGICEKGGVISEYVPGTAPSPGLFPARNRIISTLADAVLVVEARQKSGTLITVDMALEQGREVYVVPGRITDRLSDGCNRLLKQGASPALSPEQMFAELADTVWREYEQGNAGKTEGDTTGKATKGNLTAGKATMGNLTEGKDATAKVPADSRLAGLSKEQKALYHLLDFYPISVEQIWLMVQTNEALQGVTLPQVMEMLIELCVAGLVKNEGGYYGWKEPV